MAAQTFDHERLDVDRLSIDYVSRSFETSQSLSGLHRHARDQWLRAAQSIPLNIAEGNGKRSSKDRARFLDIARGSALECAAIQDVLRRTNGIKVQDDEAMKAMLYRIVAMLTPVAMKFDGVAESDAEVHADIDYDYEHRFAEHEHDVDLRISTNRLFAGPRCEAAERRQPLAGGASRRWAALIRTPVLKGRQRGVTISGSLVGKRVSFSAAFSSPRRFASATSARDAITFRISGSMLPKIKKNQSLVPARGHRRLMSLPGWRAP